VLVLFNNFLFLDLIKIRQLLHTHPKTSNLSDSIINNTFLIFNSLITSVEENIFLLIYRLFVRRLSTTTEFYCDCVFYQSLVRAVNDRLSFYSFFFSFIFVFHFSIYFILFSLLLFFILDLDKWYDVTSHVTVTQVTKHKGYVTSGTVICHTII